MKIVVVGGGVAGLGTALAAARAGHEVVVVDRDATPMPESAHAAFDWDRRGAPQVRHSHAFLARLRNLLIQRCPDIYESLLAAGATELRFTENLPPALLDFEPVEGDERLCAIACRRTTFEWVLRRSVMNVPGVELIGGVAVDGVIAEAGPAGVVPNIVGVRGRKITDYSPFEVRGDVVVDATGPRTNSAAWLVAAGVIEPEPSVETCEIVYLSRFYELRDGAEVPSTVGPIAGELGYLKFAVFIGDNRTFSLTFAVPTADKDLRVLSQEAIFEAGARQLDLTKPWLDGRARPLTEVHSMAGLRNRRRWFVDGQGNPIVTGFAAVGDAHICTNPLYGRGCSLAFVHAFAFVDSLEQGAQGWERTFHDATEREIDPWFRASVQQDKEAKRIAAAELQAPTAQTDEVDPSGYVRELFRDGLMPAVRTVPDVYRAFLRWLNLEATPDALLTDSVVLAAVMKSHQEKDSRPPEPVLGPDRVSFLAALGA